MCSQTIWIKSYSYNAQYTIKNISSYQRQSTDNLKKQINYSILYAKQSYYCQCTNNIAMTHILLSKTSHKMT